MAQRGGQRGPPETENQRRRGGDARQRHAHASRTGRDTVKEKRGGGDPERRPRGPGGGEGFREKGGRGQGGERGRWWPRPRARAPRSGPATPVASAEPWLMVRLPGGGGRRRATNEAPESPAPVMDGPRGRAEGRERAGGPHQDKRFLLPEPGGDASLQGLGGGVGEPGDRPEDRAPETPAGVQAGRETERKGGTQRPRDRLPETERDGVGVRGSGGERWGQGDRERGREIVRRKIQR